MLEAGAVFAPVGGSRQLGPSGRKRRPSPERPSDPGTGSVVAASVGGAAVPGSLGGGVVAAPVGGAAVPGSLGGGVVAAPVGGAAVPGSLGGGVVAAGSAGRLYPGRWAAGWSLRRLAGRLSPGRWAAGWSSCAGWRGGCTRVAGRRGGGACAGWRRLYPGSLGGGVVAAPVGGAAVPGWLGGGVVGLRRLGGGRLYPGRWGGGVGGWLAELGVAFGVDVGVVVLAELGVAFGVVAAPGVDAPGIAVVGAIAGLANAIGICMAVAGPRTGRGSWLLAWIAVAAPVAIAATVRVWETRPPLHPPHRPRRRQSPHRRR